MGRLIALFRAIPVAAALLAAALLASCASQGLDTSLESYWKFDEGSGTTVTDSVGTEPDGVIGGAPTWSEGKFGDALYFNGSSDNVWIDADLVFDDEYTITVWFKAESLLRDQDIVSIYALGDEYPYALHGILLEVRGDGSLRYLQRFPLGGEGGADIFAEGSYNDGVWHHAALVKGEDGTVLYIDGEVAGTNEEGAVATPEEPMDICLGVLDLERDPDRQYLGAIDELRIYSVALSEEQIAEVMAGPAVVGTR